jgi:hypothetical protein
VTTENDPVTRLANMPLGDLEVLLDDTLTFDDRNRLYLNVYGVSLTPGVAPVREMLKNLLIGLYPNKEALQRELRWICKKHPDMVKGGGASADAGNGEAFRRPPNPDQVQVLLICAEGDTDQVRGLYQQLRAAAVRPWFAEEDLLPGQNRDEILKAIRQSDVVVACLSQKFNQEAGTHQSFIKRALDKAEEQPPGTISIIPAKLEPCEVPDRLAHLKAADLFAGGGYERLMRSLQRLAKERGKEPPRFS